MEVRGSPRRSSFLGNRFYPYLFGDPTLKHSSAFSVLLLHSFLHSFAASASAAARAVRCASSSARCACAPRAPRVCLGCNTDGTRTGTRKGQKEDTGLASAAGGQEEDKTREQL